MLDRVLHELRVVFQPHLREKPRAMRPDRAYAEIQLRRDLPRRFSGRDQTEHLKLAIGKMLVQILTARVDDAEGDALRVIGRQKALAARALANRGDEVRARVVFAHVSRRAGLRRARRISRLRVHREDPQRRLTCDRTDLRAPIDARTTDETETEDA